MTEEIDLTGIYDPVEADNTEKAISSSKLKEILLEIENFINNQVPRGSGEALLIDGSNSMDGNLGLSDNDIEEISQLVGDNKNWRYSYDESNSHVLVQENTGSESQPNWKDRLTIDFQNFLVHSQKFEGDENKIIELKGKDSNDNQKWRMKYVDSDDEWKMQENTGSDDNPNWDDRMRFNYGELNQIAQNVEAEEDVKQKQIIGKDSNGNPKYRMTYIDAQDKWVIEENTGTADNPTWTERSSYGFGDLKFAAKNVEATEDVNTKVLMGKDPNDDPQWRMKYDNDTDRWVLQQNTGDAENPSWKNRMEYDFDDLSLLSKKVDSKEGDFQDGGSGLIKVDKLQIQKFLGLDGNNNLDWRINYDEPNDLIEFQENTGSNDSPTWEDRFAFELDASPQIILKDKTGIKFPDGSEIHSDAFNGNGEVSQYKGEEIDGDGDGKVDAADKADIVGTTVASGTKQLNDGSAIISTGEDDTSNTYFLALGAEDPDADTKLSGKIFWDDSDGEHKLEIVESGTTVNNPTAVYKVFKI